MGIKYYILLYFKRGLLSTILILLYSGFLLNIAFQQSDPVSHAVLSSRMEQPTYFRHILFQNAPIVFASMVFLFMGFMLIFLAVSDRLRPQHFSVALSSGIAIVFMGLYLAGNISSLFSEMTGFPRTIRLLSMIGLYGLMPALLYYLNRCFWRRRIRILYDLFYFHILISPLLLLLETTGYFPESFFTEPSSFFYSMEFFFMAYLLLFRSPADSGNSFLMAFGLIFAGLFILADYLLMYLYHGISDPIHFLGLPVVAIVLIIILDRRMKREPFFKSQVIRNPLSSGTGRMEKIKDHLITGVLSELQSSVNRMTLYADDVLASGKMDDNEFRIHSVRNISDSGRHLLSLLHHLRELYHFQFENRNDRYARTNLTVLVDAVIHMVSSGAKSDNLQIINGIQQDTPPAIIDPKNMFIILYNILQMIIRKEYGNEIRIIARKLSMDASGTFRKPGNILELCVNIRKSYSEKPFMRNSYRPYYPGKDRDASRNVDYLENDPAFIFSNYLVEAHGGEITVSSTSHRPSGFCITLKAGESERPLMQSNDIRRLMLEIPLFASEEADHLQSYRIRKSLNHMGRKKPEKILIIGKNREEQELLTDLFANEGYDTILVTQSREALQISGQTRVDLMLLNSTVPDRDDFEMLNNINDQNRSKKIPIILISDIGYLSLLPVEIRIVIDDMVATPLVPEELFKRVTNHLELSRLRRMHSEGAHNLETGAAEKLRESEERFRNLADSSYEGILIHDNGIILDTNNRMLEMLGLEQGEKIERTAYELLSYAIPEDRMQRRPLHGEFLDFELIRVDGARLPVEFQAREITYRGRKAEVVSFRDVSNRRKMELLKQDTERIFRHDIKNPLNGVIGFTELLLGDRDLKGSHRELIGLIHESSTRMLKMINNSMDLLHMEEGSYDLKSEDLDLTELLFRLHNQFSSLRREKSVRMKYSHDGYELTREDRIHVRGEEIHLLTLFGNLIKNAIEASSSDGEVRIQITRVNEVYQISIHNEGVIPSEIKERLFEKYITARKPGGSGLGTYSSRLIARIHGGDIHFTSDTTGGTSFTVILPAP